MVIPPFNRNPYNGYINPYYWVDDHPLLYGNNGSLDPGTYNEVKLIQSLQVARGWFMLFMVTKSSGFSGLGWSWVMKFLNIEAKWDTVFTNHIPPGKWMAQLACIGIGLSWPLSKQPLWELRHLLSLRCISTGAGFVQQYWFLRIPNINHPSIESQCRDSWSQPMNYWW